MDSTALTNAELAQSTELSEPDPLTRHEVFVVRAAVVLSIWAALILCEMLQSRFFERGKISGGSMAERLLGVHLRVPCRDCEFVFYCSTRLNPIVAHKAVCPNCGFANRFDAKNMHDSDEVLIDRADQAIHRWDVVAFNPWEGLRTQMTLDEEDLVVKRVAALPGERVEIRNGRIYIDGMPAVPPPDLIDPSLCIPRPGVGMPPTPRLQTVQVQGFAPGRPPT
ncbi:MAG: S26 family signal peptidase [Planctomycetes bacterium]|nr:S26 family signal peptidase [Planctomycetota bacterium]